MPELVVVARHQPCRWPSALAWLSAGALGNNLIDRVIYGKVADFFHFYGFGYDWYVFNVADVAITLGAMAILYDVLQAAASAMRI